MASATRLRERIFSIVMWLVSVVFAGFLIGFGGLVIADLPRVERNVSIEQFLDPAAIARVEESRRALAGAEAAIADRLAAAEQRLQGAANEVQTAQAGFDTWIATRTATTDPAQDSEVLRRTRALESLRQAELAARQARDAIAAELDANRQAQGALQEERYALEEAARPAFERADFFQELKVFSLRLALTLPLLALAAWLLFQKNKGEYWPLKRGFILFAAYAFFFELIPYLPDYGWYVRFGVGILLTAILSHFAIKWMRNYLAAREAEAKKVETERTVTVAYDEALKKLAARTCPSCERPVATTDETPPDFCVHCGLKLYNHCQVCATRKYAFFRFCMKCGAPAGATAPAA